MNLNRIEDYQTALREAVKKIPFGRKPLALRTHREMTQLCILGHWIIGAKMKMKGAETGSWVPVDRDYADLETFKSEMEVLLPDPDTVILYWYLYKPEHNTQEPILIPSKDKNAISSALTEFTNQPFSLLFYHDKDNEKTLSSSGIIVHRKTGQLFQLKSPQVAFNKAS